MTKNEICSLIIQTIKDYLSTPSRLDLFKASNHFVRKRLLSMLHVIMYLFFSSKASMATNLTNIRREFCSFTTFPKKISKQAISYARQWINPILFKELFNISVDTFYNNLTIRKLWHGFHIYAIDGSRFELPNSKKNFDEFGELFNSHNPDVKFTQALASMVYDVLDDYIVHATINRYLSSERDAAIRHLETLKSLDIFKDSIVIFDRGYYSKAMFHYCVEHGYYCVMRLKEGLNLSKSVGKKRHDIITILPGDPKTGEKDIDIRVISVKLDSGEYEYLATNIFDKSITSAMFRELYFLRWPCETKYLELKERLQIEDFNGATPIAIVQEFFINLLLSNLSALIKASADDAISEKSRPSNKYRYQSNRAFIIGQMKLSLPKMLFGLSPVSPCLEDILNDACLNKSQIQPGRKFKRKSKKDNKRTHFRNRKPCF